MFLKKMFFFSLLFLTSQVAFAGNILIGIAGGSGAGKTTILNILSGVIKPTSGTARTLGYDVAKEPQKAKASIGYLPEEPAIYELLTVRELAS